MCHPVVGVQVSGEGNAARLAIAMSNGRTTLYRGDGVCIRP